MNMSQFEMTTHPNATIQSMSTADYDDVDSVNITPTVNIQSNEITDVEGNLNIDPNETFNSNDSFQSRTQQGNTIELDSAGYIFPRHKNQHMDQYNLDLKNIASYISSSSSDNSETIVKSDTKYEPFSSRHTSSHRYMEMGTVEHEPE